MSKLESNYILAFLAEDFESSKTLNLSTNTSVIACSIHCSIQISYYHSLLIIRCRFLNQLSFEFRKNMAPSKSVAPCESNTNLVASQHHSLRVSGSKSLRISAIWWWRFLSQLCYHIASWTSNFKTSPHPSKSERQPSSIGQLSHRIIASQHHSASLSDLKLSASRVFTVTILDSAALKHSNIAKLFVS